MNDEREIARLPGHVTDDLAAAKRTGRRGHAARPGTGPEGERCGTCRHARRVLSESGRAFHKCDLTRGDWTRGTASDIRLKDPACGRWAPEAGTAAALSP